MAILDSFLQKLSLLAIAAKDLLILIVNWLLPIDMSPYQIMLSVFKIGTIFVLAYIIYDNSHSYQN